MSFIVHRTDYSKEGRLLPSQSFITDQEAKELTRVLLAMSNIDILDVKLSSGADPKTTIRLGLKVPNEGLISVYDIYISDKGGK